MYTIIDEALEQQWKQPIRPRKSPRTASSGENYIQKEGEYAPWKIPFPNEKEWQAFLRDFLDSLEPHREARNIVSGVLTRLEELMEKNR